MKLSRNFLYPVILLLILMIAQPVMANVRDVPTDHWAYQAVVSLVNRGYLAVYEDGTFQGNRSVDRYTLASALAKILDEIEAGRVSGYQGDAEILKELTTELRTELVEWYANRAQIETSVSDTQKRMIATEDRVNRVVSTTSQLQEEVAKLKADLMAEASGTASSYATLQASIADLEGQVNKLISDITRLENWTGEKSAVFATLESDGSNLQRQLNTLADSVKKTDGEIDALEQNFQEYAAQLAALQDEFYVIQSKVGVSEEELSVLARKISDDISLQMNASLIREQRLERDLKELREEFDVYKEISEKELRSAKSSALIATVAATISLIFAFVY